MLMKLYTTMTFAFSSPYPPNHKVELSERMTINPCCRVEKIVILTTEKEIEELTRTGKW